jgi:hypothetical protein
MPLRVSVLVRMPAVPLVQACLRKVNLVKDRMEERRFQIALEMRAA